MNGRTELTAGLTGIINGIFVVLQAFGIWQPTPELITSINGILIPIIMIFLGSRVSKVEAKADNAAVNASIAADKAATTTATVNRIETKVSG